MKNILILLIFIVPFGVLAQTEETTESDPVDAETSADVHRVEEVTVTGKRIEKKPRYMVSGQLLRRAPGSAGDPIRGIARLPSIATINDFFGVLSVRGGAPGDNLYYFDRLPLGYPYHLLGIVSVVSSESIGKVEVYPGGFGAEFGADSQAVIDIHSGPNNMESLGRLDLTLKPSFIYSEGFFSGAFSFKEAPKNDMPTETDERTASEQIKNT